MEFHNGHGILERTQDKTMANVRTKLNEIIPNPRIESAARSLQTYSATVTYKKRMDTCPNVN